MQEPKSRKFSVENFRVKFDAKQALGCNKNSWISICLFSLHTLTWYILRRFCQM